MMHTRIPSAATVPEIREVPPDMTFILDRPMVASPPIPPRKPAIMLAPPRASITRFGSFGVLSTSVTTSAVRSVSIEPTAQSKTERMNMLSAFPGRLRRDMSYWGSIMNGTGNLFSSVMRATSPIVLVKKPSGRISANSSTAPTMSARSEEGTRFEKEQGSLGTSSMIRIAVPQISSMNPSSAPERQAMLSSSLKEKICETTIRMPMPLRKPTMTLSGMILVKR
mmetsp:Transcript_14915/g.37802  ORF Transcript_14915/g.37802 Transcript_14915/m.37802 type:complete len:224 (+) Transcript_14915:742-1413(+)